MSVESATPEASLAGRRARSSARTGSGRTRGTRTTPAATPRRRATGIDPVTGLPGRAAVGQGLRRRPRDADRGRPRGPPARPPARARRRLSGRRPRGRDGRRVRLLPPRPRRRRAVDRHGDARPRRRRPRRPPPPGLGDRPRDRRRRRGADPRAASATAWPGSTGGVRASSSASTSPRSAGDHPEAIGAILGGHGITAWGDTSEECEAHSLEIIRTAERFIAERRPAGAVRARRSRATSRCPRRSATPARRRSCR